MDCSTEKIEHEYGVTGVLYDIGSVYDGLSRLTDERKAQGMLYRLETVLMIIIMAKLCGADTPLAITDWGKKPRGANLRVAATGASHADLYLRAAEVTHVSSGQR